MLRSAKGLQGFAIHATDGNIGHVEEFYFDDEHWTVRYLVVNTGSWLLGRRVLISPMGIRGVDWEHRAVDLGLTREQVASAPDIDTDKPVSRQQEWNYYGYYGWPIYWGGGLAWGAAMYPGLMVPPPGTINDPQRRDLDVDTDAVPGAGQYHPYDTHLRSTKEVAGYGIIARDGELGHVEDFLIDDRSWGIRYLTIDTTNWWPTGKMVLIPPQWLDSVSWAESKVRVDHTREEIRSAPEWDPNHPVTRGWEERLHGHFGRPGYWNGEPETAPTPPAGHPEEGALDVEEEERVVIRPRD